MSLPKSIDLACKEVVELVTDFLSGAMTSENQIALEQHLHVCPACTMYVTQMKQTIRLASALRADTAKVPPKLSALFRGWSQRERSEKTDHEDEGGEKS